MDNFDEVVLAALCDASIIFTTVARSGAPPEASYSIRQVDHITIVNAEPKFLVLLIRENGKPEKRIDYSGSYFVYYQAST